MTFIESSHTGFVVRDLDSSAAELAEHLGVQWASVQHREMSVRTSEGTIQASFRFTYSTHASGASLIELIEGQQGTPWWSGEAPWTFHHLGFWADGLRKDSARLDAAGLPLVATMAGGDEPRGFVYHQPRHGPMIELVDAARRMDFQSWLAGGDFPQA